MGSNEAFALRKWRNGLLVACTMALVIVVGAVGCIRVVTPDASPPSQTPQTSKASAPQASAQKPQSQLESGASIPALARTAVPASGTSGTLASPKGSTAAPPALPKDAALFVGSWSIYSQRLFYDAGGASNVGTGGLGLQLTADGKWAYGSMMGHWSVSTITPDDWTRWKIKAYGPTRKIVLSGWDQGTVDGPVEESSGRVNFIWVLYHVGPPVVPDPGWMWTKFGHA